MNYKIQNNKVKLIHKINRLKKIKMANLEIKK